MKKFFLFVLVLQGLFSCKDTDVAVAQDDSDSKEVENIIVGANKDSEGCLTTAGYTWSKLKKDCVRLFDSGVRLYPKTDPNTQDALLITYLILSDDGMEAEVFIPNQDQSLVLIREKEATPWVFNEWELTAFEGFTLRKNSEILFSGDGEIGPKFTGSDKNGD
jgi:hypothetical protein